MPCPPPFACVWPNLLPCIGCRRNARAELAGCGAFGLWLPAAVEHATKVKNLRCPGVPPRQPPQLIAEPAWAAVSLPLEQGRTFVAGFHECLQQAQTQVKQNPRLLAVFVPAATATTSAATTSAATTATLTGSPTAPPAAAATLAQIEAWQDIVLVCARAAGRREQVILTARAQLQLVSPYSCTAYSGLALTNHAVSRT